jgi:hypothetical protein
MPELREGCCVCRFGSNDGDLTLRAAQGLDKEWTRRGGHHEARRKRLDQAVLRPAHVTSDGNFRAN